MREFLIFTESLGVCPWTFCFLSTLDGKMSGQSKTMDMNRILLLLLLLITCTPSFGQFKHGMMDRTGEQPVFRSDLTPATAQSLLCGEDYVKYCNSQKLYKAGTITLAVGCTVMMAAAVPLTVELVKVHVAMLSNLLGMPDAPANEKLLEVLPPFIYAGSGVAVVGLGLMIGGTVKTIKITNKYYREHPAGQLSIGLLPGSIGLAYRF